MQIYLDITRLMLTNKIHFSLHAILLTLLSAAVIFPSYADTEVEAEYEPQEAILSEEAKAAISGLEQTLEYNFSPVDRARLRKALADYARNNDPEHIKIQRKRKAMKESLEERFKQCNNDLDDSLDRQEVTECLPQIARHFSTVDVDEDGVITFEELELAQAKWTERQKAAEAKLEAQRIKEAEAKIKEKANKPKKSKQASHKDSHPG